MQMLRSDVPPQSAAILGGRRARQGLGPFVARDLVRQGCNVTAISCTRPDNLIPALEDMERIAGIRPQGFISIRRMLDETKPGLAAILTPPSLHLEHLEQALEAGCHVLCEKPLLWPPNDAHGALDIARRFEEQGLVLAENCQWPHVLPVYDRLHPGIRNVASRLEMLLTPDSTGMDALRDCLSHLISLALATLPDDMPELEGPVSFDETEAETKIAFNLRCGGRALAVTGTFRPSDQRPRPAAFGFDGHWAHRQIDPGTYAMHLTDKVRTLPLPDPLGVHVRTVLERIRRAIAGGNAPADADIHRRAALTADVIRRISSEPSSIGRQLAI